MMLREYMSSDHEFFAFLAALEFGREWAKKNQAVVGVQKAAIGAGKK